MGDHNLNRFLYPPASPLLVFNYLDTVNVSWMTIQAGSSSANLYLWFHKDIWQNGKSKLCFIVPHLRRLHTVWGKAHPFCPSVYAYTVPSNGSVLVPLDYDSVAIAQARFTMEYNATGGTSESYSSSDFAIDHDTSKVSVTWSISSLADPRASTPSSMPVISTATTPAPSIPFSATSNPSAAPTNTGTISALNPSGSTAALLTSMLSNRLSAGALAGIVIAVAVVIVSLTLLGIWLIRRKRKRYEQSDATYTKLEVDEKLAKRNKELPSLPVERNEWPETQLAPLARHYLPYRSEHARNLPMRYTQERSS